MVDKAVEAKTADQGDKIYGSIDEMLDSGPTDVEYEIIEGFKPGEKIRIGSVTAGDIIEWQDMLDGPAKRNAGLKLICKSLVGPAPGNVRFADNDKNIAKLKDIRHKDTERILKAIVKLNGMNVKDEAAAKKD
jgi:hypothetical protein